MRCIDSAYVIDRREHVEGHGMKEKRHKIDGVPETKDDIPIYIHEPELLDGSLLGMDSSQAAEPEDNVRIFVPLDISHEAVLRRLDWIIQRYGEATEKNELDFARDVKILLSQVEIYDQVWLARHGREGKKHSGEGARLIQRVVDKLEQIPDGCAEQFPFELVNQLRLEYNCDK